MIHQSRDFHRPLGSKSRSAALERPSLAATSVINLGELFGESVGSRLLFNSRKYSLFHEICHSKISFFGGNESGYRFYKNIPVRDMDLTFFLCYKVSCFLCRGSPAGQSERLIPVRSRVRVPPPAPSCGIPFFCQGVPLETSGYFLFLSRYVV